MERSIYVSLFVVYLTLLSEEGHSRWVKEFPTFYGLNCSIQKSLLVLYRYVHFLWLMLYQTICSSPWPCVTFCNLCLACTEVRGPSLVIYLQLTLHISNLRTCCVTQSGSALQFIKWHNLLFFYIPMQEVECFTGPQKSDTGPYPEPPYLLKGSVVLNFSNTYKYRPFISFDFYVHYFLRPCRSELD
jgi:hypothetical protein